MEPLTIIIALVVLLLFITLLIYNNLISKRNAMRQARSSIDVYLTQRFDLIPNLVECVKSYAKHEKEIFESITNLRSEYNTSKSLDTASKLNNKLNNLMLIGENYPELKSSENFLNLQKNLTKIEDQLQAARRLYNMDVTRYNTSLQIFPSNLIASLFHFKEAELFKLENSKIANNPNINI